MRSAAVVDRPIDPAAVMERVKSPDVGAISMFVGTVRDTNDGRSVSGIEYSGYVTMAEEELNRVIGEACEKFGIGTIVVEHRIGSLSLGDVSIAIAVAHGHRARALDATRFVIDEIKSRVPIWKLEHYVDGGREWVDPTRADAATSA